MPLIEGIGDEVTLLMGGLLLCIILMLAWLSTHTADIPLLREVGVIVVELSQRHSRTQHAASEERSERDDTSSSADHEISSTDAERQRNEIHDRSGETSSSQNRSASENYDTAGERIPISSSPSSNESVDIQTSLAGVSASPDLLPENVEDLTRTVKRASLMNASPQSSHKSEGDNLSNDLGDSETLVPKASIVVDDSRVLAYPSEDEIRQRRVQYFQSNKPGHTISGENTIHSGPEDDSLSETSTYDSDITRHLKDSVQSCYPPSSDQNKTAGTTQEGIAGHSVMTSHLASEPAADSDNIATSSHQEDISDSSNVQGESSPSSKIRVRLKYMNETQRLVYAEPLDTIGEFRRIHFQTELQDNKWVRFIYNGQDLRDDARTLQACNISDNCTMHCLITAQTQPQLPRDAVAEEDEDSFMGAMMYPLFTIIILIVWYFRFTYRQYFSAMSTVCLIGISFLLALSYISSLRTAERAPPQQRASPSSAATGGERGGAREEHQHAE